MTSDHSSPQEREWLLLNERISRVLDGVGRKDAFGKGDFWILDENWGVRRQEVEIQNLELLRPSIIFALQEVLADHPDWRITVSVAIPGTEDNWPGMGLIVSRNEIVDELKRQYLPEEFAMIHYRRNQ